jgi:succinoglycan biosynthesis protein ExoM
MERRSDVRPLVAVCVCTCRRPAMLEGLLRQIAICATEAHELADTCVVVVDDDPERSAEAVAAGAAEAFPRGVRYVSTGSGNIAVARNRALEAGLEDTTWLALIDDDCMPEPEWLRELLGTQQRFEADIVSGRCIDRGPPGAPPWLEEQFITPPTTLPDGAVVDHGFLKNTLLTAAFLERTKLRFDPSFGRTGGEDAMFFYDAEDAGAHHRHAAHAVVHEELPVGRTTLGYQLRRRLWYGNTETRTSVTSGRASRRRMAARGIKQILLAVARPVARVAKGHSPHLRSAAGEVLQGAGRVIGAAGVWLAHH